LIGVYREIAIWARKKRLEEEREDERRREERKASFSGVVSSLSRGRHYTQTLDFSVCVISISIYRSILSSTHTLSLSSFVFQRSRTEKKRVCSPFTRFQTPPPPPHTKIRSEKETERERD
jgi:hypothetical protein